MKLEHKAMRLAIKAKHEDGVIEGMGSVFGNVDHSDDVIEPGAFGDSLREGRAVKMLWQHDPDNPIGVWDEVRETDEGLFVKGRVATETQLGADTMTLLRMGAIDGLSIGYRTLDHSYDEDGTRRLKKIELWEVSVVTFPCNEQARLAAVKSLEEIDQMQERGIQMLLQEAGLTRVMAKGVINRLGALAVAREASHRKRSELEAAIAAARSVLTAG